MAQTATITGMPSPEEMAGMAIERNGLYRLLAAVFREEIALDLLVYILKPSYLEKLAETGVDVTALSALTPDTALQEQLSLEYSRLFIGPGKHVAPYESVHRGGEGATLWGPETSALKRFIEHCGFVYDEQYHDLPDHISIELELMGHLTNTEAEAWSEGDTQLATNSIGLQKEFLSRHLANWTKPFANRVTEMAESHFYPQMANLIHNFVQAEKQEIEEYEAL